MVGITPTHTDPLIDVLPSTTALRAAEANGAADAIKKPRAQFFFEFVNLLRQRRLGHVGQARRAAEATTVGNGTKVAELMKFHFFIL